MMQIFPSFKYFEFEVASDDSTVNEKVWLRWWYTPRFDPKSSNSELNFPQTVVHNLLTFFSRVPVGSWKPKEAQIMNYGRRVHCLSRWPGTNSRSDWILDGGYLPNAVIRIGIRRQLRDRIELIKSTSLEESYKRKMSYVELLRSRPIAIETATANEQHYEVGTGVLAACLGPRMKYSCCLYPKGGETLAQAEIAMLETYVEKAQLKDGMSILDLGWVSMV